jgi:hypothetical protein
MIYSEDSRSDWRTVDLAGSDGGFDWLTGLTGRTVDLIGGRESGGALGAGESFYRTLTGCEDWTGNFIVGMLRR